MDTQPEPNEHRRSPALPIAIVAVVLAAVSAAVLFFVVGSSNNQFDPVQVAELTPDDAHFFMAVNTDFASAPWTAMPQLLNSLGVEQQVRDDLDESAADEDLDYNDDIVPVLGSIRRAGFAAQYTSDGGEWVAFIDSRDPQRVIDISFGTDVLDSEERDDELGLDFKLYLDRTEPTDDPTAVTTYDGIIYIAGSPAHISNFIRRQQNTAPLSESERFRSAIEEVAADALLVGYGNGNLLDHRDFRDIIDAFSDSAEIDPREGTLAFSVTARKTGFGSRVVVRLDSGFGTFQETVATPTDLAGIAGLTPDDAIFLFAGSGLHDALVQAIEAAGSEPMVADTLEPFEELAGLSLEDDLIPLFGSSYAIAVGGDGLTASETDFDDMWSLGLIGTSDPVRLAERLRVVLNELELSLCGCDSGVTIEEHATYVGIKWPEAPLSDATLDQDAAFIATLSLLQRDPTNLLFVNISALPEDLLSEASADWSSDPDGYDMDLTAILGFAMAAYADETSISLDFVLPIAATSAD